MKIVLYSGAGNTFFLIDNRQKAFNSAHAALLCATNAVDGCILVEPSSKHHAWMRIFNRDGSEAEMCGNGLRCLIYFLQEIGINAPIYEIETLAGLQRGWRTPHGACVQLPPPTMLKLHIKEQLHFLNTGVPHAVLFVADLEKIDVPIQGKTLRYSPLFSPQGANINFVRLQNKNSIAIRTYERGVEGETLACGTGACASALVAHLIHHLASPIEVEVRSQERLKISFNADWSKLCMEGPVKRVQEGNFDIKDQTLIMAAI